MTISDVSQLMNSRGTLEAMGIRPAGGSGIVLDQDGEGQIYFSI